MRGVSFAIEAGEVFCLLGPNGAGKTTTVEIIEGHRLPTSGSVSVLGRDPGHAASASCATASASCCRSPRSRRT